MTVDVASSLDRMVASVLEAGHLPECPHARRGRADDCDWCRWALVIPDLSSLVVIGDDALTLMRCDVLDTVAGVVAATRLFELFEEIDIGTISVASTRELAANVSAQTARCLDRLRGGVGLATRAGGPLIARCERTAGAIAATTLQAEVGVDVTALPAPVQAGLNELAAMTSSCVQLSTMLPVVEHLHWRGVPDLVSQPEWLRRTRPVEVTELGQRQLAASGATFGSLEALVLESLIENLTELLLEVGELLAGSLPPVVFRRSVDERPFDGRLRSTLWRILPIDWHLTLVDTGLAAAWDTDIADGVRSTVVPWVVDAAATVLHRKGYGSALFGDPPTGDSGPR